MKYSTAMVTFFILTNSQISLARGDRFSRADIIIDRIEQKQQNAKSVHKCDHQKECLVDCETNCCENSSGHDCCNKSPNQNKES